MLRRLEDAAPPVQAPLGPASDKETGSNSLFVRFPWAKLAEPSVRLSYFGATENPKSFVSPTTALEASARSSALRRGGRGWREPVDRRDWLAAHLLDTPQQVLSSPESLRLRSFASSTASTARHANCQHAFRTSRRDRGSPTSPNQLRLLQIFDCPPNP